MGQSPPRLRRHQPPRSQLTAIPCLVQPTSLAHCRPCRQLVAYYQGWLGRDLSVALWRDGPRLFTALARRMQHRLQGATTKLYQHKKPRLGPQDACSRARPATGPSRRDRRICWRPADSSRSGTHTTASFGGECSLRKSLATPSSPRRWPTANDPSLAPQMVTLHTSCTLEVGSPHPDGSEVDTPPVPAATLPERTLRARQACGLRCSRHSL